MKKEAVISECGNYRYWLARRWGEGPLLPFILLNPSVADAEINDPTVRRGIGFAAREGYAGMAFLNLFAFRATKPANMMQAVDPVGPLNDLWLINNLLKGRLVVAAWGALGDFNGRAHQVKALAEINAVDLRCLGRTKDGHPRHPLYLPADQPLEPFA
jgi:hypothetical protein